MDTSHSTAGSSFFSAGHSHDSAVPRIWEGRSNSLTGSGSVLLSLTHGWEQSTLHQRRVWTSMRCCGEKSHNHVLTLSGHCRPGVHGPQLGTECGCSKFFHSSPLLHRKRGAEKCSQATHCLEREPLLHGDSEQKLPQSPDGRWAR